MPRKNYDTVTEALADLKKRGYTIDFSIITDEECVVCRLTSTVLSPDDFEIDDLYRFEGNTDPGDEMIVYAISSKTKNLKGIVVNAYGMYADNASSAIVKKLNTPPKQPTNDAAEGHTHHSKNQNSKEDNASPVCWGYQQYDGKTRELQEDKQIDVNNNKDNYTTMQDFVKTNIDGAQLKEAVVKDVPNRSKKDN